MRLHVLTTTSMKMKACDIAPCSQVEVDRRFRGAHCLENQSEFWIRGLPNRIEEFQPLEGDVWLEMH
jgi:hypothetical protein